jgi:hypothetical protein
MDFNQLVNLLHESDLAGMMHPKEKEFLESFIKENRDQPLYSRVDVINISKMLIKMTF